MEATPATTTQGANTMTAAITLTETGTPSRSKGRGWARIGSDNEATFATATGRTVQVEIGEVVTVHLGADLRRASGKTDKQRCSIQVRATGNETDAVSASVGSPQSYDVRIAGVVLVDD